MAFLRFIRANTMRNDFMLRQRLRLETSVDIFSYILFFCFFLRSLPKTKETKWNKEEFEK